MDKLPVRKLDQQRRNQYFPCPGKPVPQRIEAVQLMKTSFVSLLQLLCPGPAKCLKKDTRGELEV